MPQAHGKPIGFGFWPSAFVDLQQQHALAFNRIQFQKKKSFAQNSTSSFSLLRLSASRFALLVSALLIASTWRLRQSTNKDLLS
jgi:hypothetical protein